MKARDFLEQEKEVMQIVPTPFSVEAVKSSWMQKEAEFEYTGINVDDVQFTPDGTSLTLSQEGKTATVTFKYSDDVGPFAEVKSGQGESVNLDLTPLSPPTIDTQIGKQVDMNLSWMTVEAFEGIVSAANLKPIEIDPNSPPDNMGSTGSGASTKTSELPQQQTAELDAKQVPAPAPRAATPYGLPGESLYSDGKPRYYPGIKVKAIEEIGKKDDQDVEQENSDDYRHWDEGRWVMVQPTGSSSKKSYPAANWITKKQNVKLLEPAVEGTLDVFDVETESGEEESIYGFNIIGSAPDMESMYTDGTSKYHPSLKQEAVHRVTWKKGQDTFITDVEASSEKDASKKVKDSTRADKIVSVGKQVKEGKKELTLFRFAIREGKPVKISVGTTASLHRSPTKINKKESYKVKYEKVSETKKAKEFLKRFGK